MISITFVLVTQMCPTPCDPMDCSPPGSSVHEIFQGRIMEWVAISFSRGSSWPRDQTWVSCTTSRFFTTQATREAQISLYYFPNFLQALEVIISSSFYHWGHWKWKWSHSVMSDSLRLHGLYPTRLLCPWDYPGNSTGVGSHSLLQSIFLTQGLNLGLQHCRQILYSLSLS